MSEQQTPDHQPIDRFDHTYPDTEEYRTRAGILVRRRRTRLDPETMAERLAALTSELDARRGGVLSSGVDYPGRYSRWHLGYVDPPIQLQAHGRTLRVEALNERGSVLLPAIARALRPVASASAAESDTFGTFTLEIPAGGEVRTEEERTRAPSIFTALRALTRAFGSPADRNLGLYGAFGYDLAFQLEPVRLANPRPADQRDLVLHLPDRILLLDRKRELAHELSYDFEVDGRRTEGLPRSTAPAPPASTASRLSDGPDETDGPAAVGRPEPGRFADVVRSALAHFRSGDLFEVTPSHVLREPCTSPADFFGRLRLANPAPYESFYNLGEGEHLVVASPEMYVRVTGDRVETCPIAGTIARGPDALRDAEAIRTLLTSDKDEAELTMCTDVDRNDKARVCQPGSVRVIGRRQIELYSRLIHTVDHIEGRLRPGFDAFDAFLTHTWAVTVTGAPKHRAMQFIEDAEDGPRGWYGAATGFLGFDGDINTGLTLRAASIRDGIASIRVGATLLADSDPDAEEAETLLKARALLDVLRTAPERTGDQAGQPEPDRQQQQGRLADRRAAGFEVRQPAGQHRRVLLVDHQDSFVLTLADYFRQHGCTVDTLRYGFAEERLEEFAPDLVVLSPGPGRPADFGCTDLLSTLDRRRIPAFGVCLGLQAMVEDRGGRLSLLPEPMHGKASEVRVLRRESGLLAGLGETFVAGRYHSIYADPSDVPGYTVTAVSPGTPTVAMVIEDEERLRWGVQFHPESIMTATGRTGHRLLGNLLDTVERVDPLRSRAGR